MGVVGALLRFVRVLFAMAIEHIVAPILMPLVMRNLVPTFLIRIGVRAGLRTRLADVSARGMMLAGRGRLGPASGGCWSVLSARAVGRAACAHALGTDLVVVGVAVSGAYGVSQIDRGDVDKNMLAKMAFIEELRTMPIAMSTAEANEQHYEVPADFYNVSAAVVSCDAARVVGVVSAWTGVCLRRGGHDAGFARV